MTLPHFHSHGSPERLITGPVRLQLSRRKGFNLQAHSLAVNGLPAVNCARPSKWGNPYRVGTCLIPDERAAVEAFAANLPIGRIKGIDELRGKNLACWCAGEYCHADVLLREANAPICEDESPSRLILSEGS